MSKEAMKLALEALEADYLAMVADGNGHMVYLEDQAITALREALANEALERMAENARELGLDYDTPSQKEPSELEIWKMRALQAEGIVRKFMAQPQPEPIAWYVERQHIGFRDHGLKLGPFWKLSEAEEWADCVHILKALYTKD